MEPVRHKSKGQYDMGEGSVCRLRQGCSSQRREFTFKLRASKCHAER